MNTAVRLVLMMTALVLLTALVVPPWVEGTDDGWEGYRAMWAVSTNTTLTPAIGLLAIEVLAIIASGAALTLAFWNWPRRRAAADPDDA